LTAACRPGATTWRDWIWRAVLRCPFLRKFWVYFLRNEGSVLVIYNFFCTNYYVNMPIGSAQRDGEIMFYKGDVCLILHYMLRITRKIALFTGLI
jgi:hypothetical protein